MRGRLTLVAEVLSLYATGWFVWKFSLSPQLAAASPGQVILKALGFAVAAWVWSLVIAFLLHLSIRQVEHVDVVGASLRTSAAAVWFAPATILMIQLSPLAIPVALVLVINATRLLYSEWRRSHPESERVAILVPLSAGMLGAGELPAEFFPRHLRTALIIALAMQVGLTAELWHRSVVAAFLFSLGASMLTVFAISAGAWDEAPRPTLPRAIFGLLLTVLLAVAITAVGLVSGGGGGGIGTGSGDSDDPLGLMHHGKSESPSKSLRPPPEDGKGSAAKEAAAKSKDRPDIPVVTDPNLGGSFPGIILWPEVKPVTQLIEPMPAIGGKFAGTKHRFVIPFGGEYWMFRFLLPRPPRNSFFERGSPARLSFSTTDHWPLQMEAHQKLEQNIDLSCCSRLELDISNADRYPGTVTMELIGINHDLEHSEVSLGKAPVNSSPDLKQDPVKPVSETLSYPVPAELAGHSINEFKVIYQRLRGRTDKSCRVAIERFVLVPRGM